MAAFRSEANTGQVEHKKRSATDAAIRTIFCLIIVVLPLAVGGLDGGIQANLDEILDDTKSGYEQYTRIYIAEVRETSTGWINSE